MMNDHYEFPTTTVRELGRDMKKKTKTRLCMYDDLRGFYQGNTDNINDMNPCEGGIFDSVAKLS